MLGFAIRCPHCFEWSTWRDTDPLAYAVVDRKEWETILGDLQRKASSFRHPKLLQCQHAPAACPAPFYAFVFTTSELADACLPRLPSWATKRSFMLYQADRHTRHTQPPYSGILFSSTSLLRQKHIELDDLIDHELLSRSIAGMTVELNAPVTIYAARYYESIQDYLWEPIEAYGPARFAVPDKFNPFCTQCRELCLAPIITRFEAIAGPSGCPAPRDGGLFCGHPAPPCQARFRNWSRCPLYLQERQKRCPCYISDIEIIRRVVRKWQTQSLAPEGIEFESCWAGFQEIAVPIVVHEHLVAVAMSGQFLPPDPASTACLEQWIRDHEEWHPYQACLLEAHARCLAAPDPAPSDAASARRLRLTDAERRQLATLLKEDASRLEAAASAKYRTRRARSESLFKQELLGSIEHALREKRPPGVIVLDLLERMVQFWAFRASALFACRHDSRQLRLLCWLEPPGQRRIFGYEESLLGALPAGEPLSLPEPWLYDFHDKRRHPNRWIEAFRQQYEQAILADRLKRPHGQYDFLVFVPFPDTVYTLLLMARNEAEVSCFRPLPQGSVSMMCQQAILDTAIDTLTRLELNATIGQLRTSRDNMSRGLVAGSIVHDIKSPIIYASQVFDHLRDFEIEALSDAGRERVLRGGEICSAGMKSIDKVWDYTKTGELRTKGCSLERLVASCLSRFESRLAERPIHVHVALEDRLPIQADDLLLQLVFLNIFENAHKHLGPGQAVWIEGRPLPARCQIQIEDNGGGFPEAVIEEINRADLIKDYSRESCCMGLLIAKEITAVHSGTLDLGRSRYGGARITIRIPADPGAVGSSPPIDPP